MKKNYLPIVGAVCVSLGMLMATGVDYNLWQGFYALVLMGVGAWAFNRHDRLTKTKTKTESIGGPYQDAA
jgi:hypothetical protein